jgi:hypothetical protein
MRAPSYGAGQCPESEVRRQYPVIQAAAGKAEDRLNIGHIQAVENAARRRLGVGDGDANFDSGH